MAAEGGGAGLSRGQGGRIARQLLPGTENFIKKMINGIPAGRGAAHIRFQGGTWIKKSLGHRSLV